MSKPMPETPDVIIASPQDAHRTIGLSLGSQYQHFRERNLPYGLQDSLCSLTPPLFAGYPTP